MEAIVVDVTLMFWSKDISQIARLTIVKDKKKVNKKLLKLIKIDSHFYVENKHKIGKTHQLAYFLFSSINKHYSECS